MYGLSVADAASIGDGCRPKYVKMPHLRSANDDHKTQDIGIQHVMKTPKTGINTPKIEVGGK